MKTLRKFLELEGKFKNLSIKMKAILLKMSYAKEKLCSFKKIIAKYCSRKEHSTFVIQHTETHTLPHAGEATIRCPIR